MTNNTMVIIDPHATPTAEDEDLMDIPAEYVGYGMEPNRGEYYVCRADELKEGMIVLIENNREDLEHINDNVYTRRRIREVSRWCKVTQLRGTNNYDVVSFVGLYSDGTMYSRSYGKSWFWLVKK